MSRKTQRLPARINIAWSELLKTTRCKSLHLAGTPQHENAAETAQNSHEARIVMENVPKFLDTV